jgi:hypothetical protein
MSVYRKRRVRVCRYINHKGTVVNSHLKAPGGGGRKRAFTREQCKSIRKQRRQGRSPKWLARKYNVTAVTIGNVLKRRGAYKNF